MNRSGEDLHTRFRERSRRHGLACTHQREIIYRALEESCEHPSPESVYAAVRREIPSISLATVYKNIKAFVDAGMVREVSPHHGPMRVDARLEPHSHAVCRSCRAIADIPDVETHAHRLPKGFRVERQSVEFIGLCAACAREQSTH